jgi:putative copper export protein/methionine-rich copper-binding protein CopC
VKAPFFLYFALALSFIYFLGFVGIVYGHSVPDTYSLAPNTLLQNSNAFPANITIIFSERPDPKISYIHVTDSEGNRIDNGEFKITGVNERQATVLLDKNKVHDGVYSISWLTLSKDDGHISKGTYVVGVGAMTELGQNQENIAEHQETLTPVIAITKTPIIISQVCILGFVICDFIIWRGVPKTGMRNAIHDLTLSRFRKPIILSALAITAAATILLFVQAYDITESGANYFKNLVSLLYGTSNGTVWIIRIVCSAVVLLIIYIYSRQRTIDSKTDQLREIANQNQKKKTVLLSLLVVATIASIATNSIVSHSASIQSDSQLAIISDFLHFSAVSIWVGGLVYLSYVFFPKLNHISSYVIGKVEQIVAQPDSITLLTLSRFSTAASISLGVIGITGLYLAWIHINSFEDLFYSDYGKVLIIKLSIALPVLLLGAYHQFWIRRIFNNALHTGGNKKIENYNKIVNDKVLSSIKLTIKFEAILAICILCAAAFLTVTPLPTYQTEASIQNPSQQNTPAQSKFVQDLLNQGIPMTLTISPFHVGFNNFTVSIPEARQNSIEISNVFAEFKKSDGSLGPIIAKPQKINPGAYSTIGGYLSQAGQWDMKITVQRTGSYDLNYRLTVALNSTFASKTEHMNMNMPMDATLSENQEMPPPKSQYFTYLSILLATVVATLSSIFYFQAKKSMTAIQEYLGIVK